MKDCELELQSMDGKCISARYFAPLSVARGSLIVVQEIFGVNAHIAQMCEQFSHLGFHVIAPRFFDRAGTDIQLDYSEAGIAEGRRIVSEIGFDNALRDVHAAAQHLRQYGAVGVVGYCWGGTVAFLTATRLGLPAVGYYGSRIPQFLHERPQAPVMLHFGEHDASLPASAVAQIQAECAPAQCHLYHAGHGFNRKGHAEFHAVSAELALHRTLNFLSGFMAS